VENANAKWYVVRTFSGHENKVKSIIDLELSDNEYLRERIVDVLVPTEKVFEVKDGKKKTRIKNFFPGYILLQAELDIKVKDFIINTPSVMGFLGTKTQQNKQVGNAVPPLMAKAVAELIKVVLDNEK